jgi:hypothetical protein
MTKIISFSLWGQDPKYTIGAIRNAELGPEIYPSWTCRFYTGEDVTDEIKSKLLDLKSEVIEMGGADWNGMFWRFFAAENADIMISRDTDSRLSLRERAAVDEWLASDKNFHIMRDHPYHKTEILGGMWGCRNGLLKGIKGMIQDYDTKEYHNKYQVDQNFLREAVYPIVKDNSMVHDEFFEKKPFPTSRIDSQDFVGQVYNHLNQPEFTI